MVAGWAQFDCLVCGIDVRERVDASELEAASTPVRCPYGASVSTRMVADISMRRDQAYGFKVLPIAVVQPAWHIRSMPRQAAITGTSLKSLGLKRLAALVQEACDRDDVLENKVRMMLAAKDGGDALECRAGKAHQEPGWLAHILRLAYRRRSRPDDRRHPFKHRR